MRTTPAIALVTLAGSGCLVPTPSTDAKSHDTAASTTGNACPADVGARYAYLCIETTAPPSSTTTTSYGQAQEWVGTGTVVEVGGALAPEPGSTPLEQFDVCGGDYEHQVRLIDDLDGSVWTVGWDVVGDGDDDSSDGFAVGEILDYHAVMGRSYTWDYGLLLSDAAGPRFLYERYSTFDDEARGGISVSIDHYETCTTPDPTLTHDLVTISGPLGEVVLRSGQRSTVSLPARDLDFTVLGAYQIYDCADTTCGAKHWAAWEAP